jgi:signal peptidase
MSPTQTHSRPPTDSRNARHTNRHILALKALKVLLVPATIYMLWKAASVISDSRYPIVVVVSESMEPAFSRGDLLLLSNRKHIIEVGDIPVCWFPGNPLPMVHRAIAVTHTEGLLGTKTIM